MKCENCNKEIPNTATNCPYCSAPVREVVDYAEAKPKKKSTVILASIGGGIMLILLLSAAGALIKEGAQNKKRKEYLKSVQETVDAAFETATAEHEELSVSMEIKSVSRLNNNGSAATANYSNKADVDFKGAEARISNGYSNYHIGLDDDFFVATGEHRAYEVYSEKDVTIWRKLDDQSWSEIYSDAMTADECTWFFDDICQEMGDMLLTADGKGSNFKDTDATDDGTPYQIYDTSGEIVLTGCLADAEQIGDTYLKLLEYGAFGPSRGSLDSLNYEIRISKGTSQITSIQFDMGSFANYAIFGSDETAADGTITGGEGTFDIVYNSFDTAGEVAIPEEISDMIAEAKAEAEARAKAEREQLSALLTEDQIAVYEKYRDSVPEMLSGEDYQTSYKFVDVDQDGTWELLAENGESAVAQLFFIKKDGTVATVEEYVDGQSLYSVSDGMLLDKGENETMPGYRNPMQLFERDSATGVYNRTHEFDMSVKDWDLYNDLSDYTDYEKNADIMEYQVDGTVYATYDEALAAFQGFYSEENERHIEYDVYQSEMLDAAMAAGYVNLYQGYINEHMAFQNTPKYCMVDLNHDNVLDLAILDSNPDVDMNYLQMELGAVPKNKIYLLMPVNGEIQMLEQEGGDLSLYYKKTEPAFMIASYMHTSTAGNYDYDTCAYYIYSADGGFNQTMSIYAESVDGNFRAMINGAEVTADEFNSAQNEYVDYYQTESRDGDMDGLVGDDLMRLSVSGAYQVWISLQQ